MKRKNNVGSSDRKEFLAALIKEFYTSASMSAKREVLANLANFAYNPINYAYFRSLNIVDMFLSCADDADQDVRHFAVAGLCNLAADPINKGIITEKGGAEKVSSLLDCDDADTALAALTTLTYLISPSSRASIVTEANVRAARLLSQSADPRLQNIANIFLQDICNESGTQPPS